MRAVQLRIVKPDEVPVLPWYRQRAVVLTARIFWCLLIGLWLVIKTTVAVVGVMLGMFLIVVGVGAHFVGGAQR
jgi:hypothetical protein